MAWTATAWHQYRRPNARYASDLTDAEWTIIEPMMLARRRLGRPQRRICVKRSTPFFSLVEWLLAAFADGRPAIFLGSAIRLLMAR